MSRKSTLSVADLQAAYVREYGETPQQTLAAAAYWAPEQRPLPHPRSNRLAANPPRGVQRGHGAAIPDGAAV
jgi:hypothetical protein